MFCEEDPFEEASGEDGRNDDQENGCSVSKRHVRETRETRMCTVDKRVCDRRYDKREHADHITTRRMGTKRTFEHDCIHVRESSTYEMVPSCRFPCEINASLAAKTHVKMRRMLYAHKTRSMRGRHRWETQPRGDRCVECKRSS